MKKKPVVLVIFSSNCGHCKKELSFLTGLYKDKTLKDKFEVVAITTKTGGALKKLMEEKK